MKNKLGILLGSVLIVLAAGLVVVNPVGVSAASDTSGLANGANSVAAAGGGSLSTNLFGQGGTFTNIINALLFVIGLASVVMLIVGGVKYTLSAGDQKAVTDAKNTILYAIVGLAIAFLAYAIVNWVLSTLGAK